MASYVETPTRSDTAAGAIAQHLRVKTPGAVAVAGATDVSMGTMEFPCLAAGPCTVRLRSAQGTKKMVAVDAITKGNTVYAAASGKVSAAGTVREGVALETSTTDGDVIEVMDAPHVDLVAAGGITLPTVTFNGATGANEIVLPTNLADALSIEDTGVGDLIVFTTSTGSQSITVTPTVTFSADIVLPDDVDLALGTSSDALIRFSDADASNHALVIAVDDTSQQIHVTDKAAVATDWARSAGTHPELSIHSNTTPATDYLAIGNHDGTSASIDVVGGTTLNIKIAGTTEMAVTATGLTVPGMLSAPESINTAGGSGIVGHAAALVTSVQRIGTLVKTEILIDIAGLNSSAADDIIGDDGGAANCHIGQITAAINGTIFIGRMTCLEAPTTGEEDIDLYAATESTGAEDAAVGTLTNTKLLDAGGDWTVGLVKALTAFPAADKYLYLVGSGTGADATYATGIFLIELWGKD